MAAYCYPLTLRDGFSRFVLRCDALAGPHATRPRGDGSSAPSPSTACPSAFAAITGGPFASTGLGAAVAAVGLVDAPRHRARSALPPAIPSKTGRTNSFIRCSKPRPRGRRRRTRAAQQRRFARFCVEYNDERPARGLAAMPCRRAAISRRRAPCRPRLPALDYPGHWEIRRVSTIGQVSWRGRPAVSVRSARRRRRRLRRSRRRPLDDPLCHRRARHGTTNVSRSLHPLPRCPRRGAPPAPLAPRLTGRTKSLTSTSQSTVTHVAGLICYPCLRLRRLKILVWTQDPRPKTQDPRLKNWRNHHGERHRDGHQVGSEGEIRRGRAAGGPGTGQQWMWLERGRLRRSHHQQPLRRRRRSASCPSRRCSPRSAAATRRRWPS